MCPAYESDSGRTEARGDTGWLGDDLLHRGRNEPTLALNLPWSGRSSWREASV